MASSSIIPTSWGELRCSAVRVFPSRRCWTTWKAGRRWTSLWMIFRPLVARPRSPLSNWTARTGEGQKKDERDAPFLRQDELKRAPTPEAPTPEESGPPPFPTIIGLLYLLF